MGAVELDGWAGGVVGLVVGLGTTWVVELGAVCWDKAWVVWLGTTRLGSGTRRSWPG